MLSIWTSLKFCRLVELKGFFWKADKCWICVLMGKQVFCSSTDKIQDLSTVKAFVDYQFLVVHLSMRG